MSSLLEDVVAVAKQAGKQLLSFYHSDFSVEYKDDGSPVTHADKISHEFICHALNNLTPNIPIISEELLPFEAANSITLPSQRYWLIDPLDGTKEFLEKNGEFTINIALIENHHPSLGVIYAPAFASCYFAEKQKGAFKQIVNEDPIPLRTTSSVKSGVTFIISRRHGIEALQCLFKQFSSLNLIRCGSALKFCWVAEGFADLYPRFSPTCEWDTAAGQCILEEAGGAVIDRQGQILRYNNQSNLLNKEFLAVRDKKYSWLEYFKDSNHVKKND